MPVSTLPLLSHAVCSLNSQLNLVYFNIFFTLPHNPWYQTQYCHHNLCICNLHRPHSRGPTGQHAQGARSSVCSLPSVCRAHCRPPSLSRPLSSLRSWVFECWCDALDRREMLNLGINILIIPQIYHLVKRLRSFLSSCLRIYKSASDTNIWIIYAYSISK